MADPGSPQPDFVNYAGLADPLFQTPLAGDSELVSAISDEGGHVFLAPSRDNGERC